jgi:hypothetical protein
MLFLLANSDFVLHSKVLLPVAVSHQPSRWLSWVRRDYLTAERSCNDITVEKRRWLAWLARG